MYSSLYFVTSCLLVERSPTKKSPADPGICEASLPRARKVLRCASSSTPHLGRNLAVPTDDVEQSIRGVLDLQGRVLDVEALLQHGLELAADAVAVLAPADEDVGGE